MTAHRIRKKKNFRKRESQAVAVAVARARKEGYEQGFLDGRVIGIEFGRRGTLASLNRGLAQALQDDIRMAPTLKKDATPQDRDKALREFEKYFTGKLRSTGRPQLPIFVKAKVLRDKSWTYAQIATELDTEAYARDPKGVTEKMRLGIKRLKDRESRRTK